MAPAAAKRSGKLGVPGTLAVAWLVFVFAAALLAPVLPLDDPNDTISSIARQGPGTEGHILGGDALGRDMLSRLLHGARYTVGVAMVATVLACMGGIALGILSAVRQGWTDSVLGRAADALISIPHLMFALVVVAAFGTSLPVLILMAAISYVPGSYRFARALALDINAMDFVEVARARGEKTLYDGRWRPEPGKTLPPVPQGVAPVIRFRNPSDGVVTLSSVFAF